MRALALLISVSQPNEVKIPDVVDGYVDAVLSRYNQYKKDEERKRLKQELEQKRQKLELEQQKHKEELEERKRQQKEKDSYQSSSSKPEGSYELHCLPYMLIICLIFGLVYKNEFPAV